ncbi:protein [Scardovia inopinata]|uniref:DUF3071 domain-containing protein n=1 Tax=Scardovia inopinata F0304 TaxID=641146 RepID=W5IJK7_SCAIO|nr:septation protein SepH [Scardovia inopinata]EFG27210.1 hypothetical protein HMPREF9020_00849 [Scardovia inopinata F0304]BAR06821.1 conserved hypothetical protein [Scardovia inopinata JCM 12537]SUV50882.1 protein [Scardovia inopinata]
MTDEEHREAVFVTVNTVGNLIFEAEDSHERFAVEVTDELEQGILSARQILSDQKGPAQPHQFRALPIREIQLLTREGKTPEEIHQEYNVDLPLIRRFAQQVEQEKSFTISQFLKSAVSNKQDSHYAFQHTTVSDVISASISNYGIDDDDVTWNATRVNRDPWRISATFHSKGRTATATWSYNARTSDIICLNKTAQKLFGVYSSGTEPVDHEIFGPSSSEASSDFSITTRGPLTPGWMKVEDESSDMESSDMSDSQAVDQVTQDGSVSQKRSAQDSTQRNGKATLADSHKSHKEESPEQTQNGGSDADTDAHTDKNGRVSTFSRLLPLGKSKVPLNKSKGTSKQSQGKKQEETTSKPAPEQEGKSLQSEEKKGKKSRRRSSIPQWDEILFGD